MEYTIDYIRSTKRYNEMFNKCWDVCYEMLNASYTSVEAREQCKSMFRIEETDSENTIDEIALADAIRSSF